MPEKVFLEKAKELHQYMNKTMPKQIRDMGLQFFISRFRKQGWHDNIQKFYYFKNKGKNLYYNVAEVARKKKNGKIQLERFLYSITNDIPTKE